MCGLSCFALATLWTEACQAPLSMGFFRREHWSGLPCPPPGDLPNPGIELAFLAWAGRFFTTRASWETLKLSELLSPSSMVLGVRRNIRQSKQGSAESKASSFDVPQSVLVLFPFNLAVQCV